MAARGLDGGAGWLPADDRRSRCADACMSVTTPRQRRAGAPSTTRALPLKPVPKPTKWPRGQQAMSAVRRCLRTRAGHLGNREADSGDSGHGVCFTAEPLREADGAAPEPRGRLS